MWVPCLLGRRAPLIVQDFDTSALSCPLPVLQPCEPRALTSGVHLQPESTISFREEKCDVASIGTEDGTETAISREEGVTTI